MMDGVLFVQVRGFFLSDIHVKPVTIRTKSTTLNDLQLMPTPPELVYRRKRIIHNIVASALSEMYVCVPYFRCLCVVVKFSISFFVPGIRHSF